MRMRLSKMNALMFLSLFFLILATSQLSLAEIQQVTVKIDGMAWHLWALETQNSLSRLEDVEKAKVSFEKDLGFITLKKEKPLRPGILRKAVEDAGFTAKWIDLKAVGKITEQNGKWIFQVDGVDQSFVLQENELLKKLKKTDHLGEKTFMLTGRVQEEKEAVLILYIKEFAVKWDTKHVACD